MLTGGLAVDIRHLDGNHRAIRAELDRISTTAPRGCHVLLIVGSTLPALGAADFMRDDLLWEVSAADTVVLRAWRDAYYGSWKTQVAA